MAIQPVTPHSVRRTPAVKQNVQPSVESAFTPDEVTNPLRHMLFRLSLVFVFLEFSMLHQTLSILLNANLYLMNIVGIPLLIGVFICGGFKHAFDRRTALYWCGFALWMLLALPFSSWKGGSFEVVTSYMRANLPLLFFVACFTFTWEECEKMVSAAAFGALCYLLTAHYFQVDDSSSRMDVQGGTISNSNDVAAHLIIGISFLMWVGLSSKSKVRRIVAFIAVGVGILYILKTASRGAEVALAVALLLFFVRASARQKIAVAVIAPIGLVSLLMFLPSDTLERLQNFSSNDTGNGVATEATASAVSRQYLLKKSFEYTFQFPLFGVGPGQFRLYEGSHNQIGGTSHGNWHDTHNSYTQASSECGIPAGLFYLAGALSTILLFDKTLKQAKMRPDSMDIQRAAFCLFVGSAGFYVAIGFLNFAYLFYGPFLGGLAVAISRAADEEFRLRDRMGQPSITASLTGPPRPRSGRTARPITRLQA